MAVAKVNGYDTDLPISSPDGASAAAQGFKSQNFQRARAHTTGASLTNGTIFLGLVGVKPGMIINNIHFVVETAATTSALAQGALMDRLGNRLAVTSDSAADRTATETAGLQTLALTAAYTVPNETNGLYVAILSSASVAPTTIVGSATVTDQAAAAARTGFFQPNGTAGTSQTAIGTTETVATTSAIDLWVAVS